MSDTATDRVDPLGRVGGPWRWGLAGVVALAVVVHLPYAVEGPTYLLDDYYTLWFRHSRGLLGTAGPGQLSARPGAWVSYLVEFGVLGHHPLAGYVLLAALDVVAAGLLYRALVRLVPVEVAGFAAVLWVLLADHSTLDHWLSTINIALGLCLFLAGIERLAAAMTSPPTFRGSSRVPPDRSLIGATLLLVGSGLCYEATLAVSALALLAVPRICRRPVWTRRTALAEAALVATGVWMLVHSRHQLGGGSFDYRSLPMSLFGTGVLHAEPVGAVLVVLTLVVIGVSAAREWRRSGDLGSHLVVAGLVVIVAGTLAFARDPISPLDLGDRVNQVASIGAALVWTGGLIQLGRARWVGRAAATALLVVAGVGHLARDLDYRDAGRDNARIFGAVLASYGTPPEGNIVVGPMYLSHHGVTGMLGPEVHAFEVVTRRQGWNVWVALSPAEFNARPRALRVTVP